MTTKTFPTAPRAVVALFALLAAGLVVPGGAARAVSPQQQVKNARTKLAIVEKRLADSQAHYAEIQAQLAIAAGNVEDSEARMQAVTVELLQVRERLGQARRRHRRVQARLDARAQSVFMEPASSNLDLFLGATSLSDLADRVAFVGAVASSDAELAAEVEATKRTLSAEAAHLETLREARQKELVARRERAAAVRTQLDEAQRLVASISKDQSRAERLVKKAKEDLAAWERRQNAISGPSHAVVPLPAEYANVLQVCPVQAPYAYGDGFGAPRYAGGYHLHKGVDILAPKGAEIRAPFDGTASTGFNTLGGNVVSVAGRYGTVYNAHLSAYSGNSNGPVHAGDVIGYVGDTGDATGIFHDHFEFHPYVMPSSWPVSAYGYSIIEDAVNPYPLLTHACP